MDNIKELIFNIQKIIKCKINKIQLIQSTNNIVYFVCTDYENYYLKIYKGSSVHSDNELLLYKSLSDEYKLYLKDLVFCDESCISFQFPYALFKEEKGFLLADLLKQRKLNAYQSSKVVDCLLNYFQGIHEVRTKDFGYIKGKLMGSHENWMDYLFDYQKLTCKTLLGDLCARKWTFLPYYLIQNWYDDLNTNEIGLAPIDTNFRNVLVKDDFKIKIIDPGAIISGPLIASLGELMVHSYGTLIFTSIIDRINFTEKEEMLMYIYAVLSSLNILAYLIRNKACDIKEITPFGNDLAFYQLIDIFLKKLNIHIEERI